MPCKAWAQHRFSPRKLLERELVRCGELQNRQAVHTRVGGGVVHSALLIGSCDQVHASGISLRRCELALHALR